MEADVSIRQVGDMWEWCVGAKHTSQVVTGECDSEVVAVREAKVACRQITQDVIRPRWYVYNTETDQLTEKPL